MDPLLVQGAISLAVVHLGEFLKGPNGPRFIRMDTGQLNGWLSWAAAAAVGLGISLQGDWTSGWNVTIPPGQQLIESFARIMLSRGQQQLYYRFAISGPVRFVSRDGK